MFTYAGCLNYFPSSCPILFSFLHKTRYSLSVAESIPNELCLADCQRTLSVPARICGAFRFPAFPLSMASAQLLTAASPRALLSCVVEEICQRDADEGWCIVPAGSHLRRDIHRLLLERCPGGAWIGFRTLALDELLAHFARDLDPRQALTALQVRQVVASVIREVHDSSGGEAFQGQVFDGRISETTLRTVAHLFSELEPYRLGPGDLARRLLEGPVSDSLSQRAREIVSVYERYLDKLKEHRYEGPRSREIEAAERARAAPPPDGVRRFVFLGLDGSSPSDPGVRVARALVRNPNVDEVRLALVLPDSMTGYPWEAHGNEVTYERWIEDVGRRDFLHPPKPPETMPADLLALVTDPFTYRERAPATGAVRGVQLPDLSAEAEWVAGEIKRSILSGEVAPDEVAVVARDMGRRAEELEHTMRGMGLPVVSSRETACADVPAVRALLAWARLEAYGWRTRDLVALAESPYLPLRLNPTLLARIGSAGTLPEGPEDWAARIRRLAEADAGEERHDPGSLPGSTPEDSRHLRAAFDAFWEAHREILGPVAERTPERRVQALISATDRWRIEDGVYGIGDEVPPAERALLARTDLDGINALLRAMDDWLRGREIAGLASEAMDPSLWYAELESVAREAKIRSSTYPISAVHLLAPQAAALRSFRHVYLIGLADGIWPARNDPSAHSLTEEERRALKLPAVEERAARERLFFHLAAGTATKQITLTYPALDARGRVLVPSPFISCLGLRIDGFQVRVERAQSLVPSDPSGVLSPVHLDWIAAQACLRLAEAAEGGAEGILEVVNSDPLVGAWLSEPSSQVAAECWTVERLREDALARQDESYGPFLSFVGVVPPQHLPAALTSDEAAFSPSELERHGQCAWRFFATRALGLFAGRSEEDEDPNEAGAFGILQHQILERFYGEAERDGRLPPRSEADVGALLARLAEVGRAVIRAHAVSSHEQLWSLDLEFVVDVLRRFVRRDLERMHCAHVLPDAIGIRTRIKALEARISRMDGVEAEFDGVRFRLYGAIDRVEEVDDPRLPDALQGWLVLKDYKSSRDDPSRLRITRFTEGRSIQLPLYAVLAEKRWGQRVYSLGELKISLGSDPDELSAGWVMPDGQGGITLQRHPDADPRRDAPEERRNLVIAAQNAALRVAAERVRKIRSGRFDPPAERQCWGCHLGDVCRASRYDNPERGRERARMPLTVGLDELAAVQGGEA